MGYTIEFDGKEVERKDQTNLTLSNNLSSQTRSPSTGGYFDGGNTTFGAYTNDWTWKGSVVGNGYSTHLVTNDYVYFVYDDERYIGTDFYLSSLFRYPKTALTREPATGYLPTPQNRIDDNTGTQETIYRNGSAAYQTIPNQVTHEKGNKIYVKGPHTGSYHPYFIYHVNNPVINSSQEVVTNGENITGGVQIDQPTVSAVQIGSPNATLPSTKFGIEAKHNGKTIAKLDHLSPSVSTEAMRTDTEVTKVFDSEAGDVTIEAVGTNETQHIRDVKLIVEEL